MSWTGAVKSTGSRTGSEQTQLWLRRSLCADVLQSLSINIARRLRPHVHLVSDCSSVTLRQHAVTLEFDSPLNADTRAGCFLQGNTERPLR